MTRRLNSAALRPSDWQTPGALVRHGFERGRRRRIFSPLGRRTEDAVPGSELFLFFRACFISHYYLFSS